MRDHLVRPHRLAVVSPAGAHHVPPLSNWSPLVIEALSRDFFASPFGMAQDDGRRRELLAEILEVVLRTTGDPTQWDANIVTGIVVAEMPHQPHLPGGDRRPLPDLLRGFIGFCVAEQALRADYADDAIAAVSHWCERWDRPDVLPFDPWSAERRELDQLRVEVGTGALLRSLDASPLDGPLLDASPIPDHAADSVDQVLQLIDRACALWRDPEVRTAVHRLTARVAAGDTSAIVDQPDPAVSAAVLVWIVARGNDAFGRGGPRVMDLMAVLGLRQASPASWARPYLRAAGLWTYGHRHAVTLGPDLLTSAHRRSIIDRRDHCLRVIGADEPSSYVLQIAHGASRDPGAATAGQRAPSPRRDR